MNVWFDFQLSFYGSLHVQSWISTIWPGSTDLHGPRNMERSRTTMSKYLSILITKLILTMK
jgi:hypothetical protein